MKKPVADRKEMVVAPFLDVRKIIQGRHTPELVYLWKLV